MCDILVATSKATASGENLFAKNSDRDPNEAQVIEFIPRQQHDEEKVKLTYVEFPQVKETYSIIISRPWWMWGAEMGANEHGLVIGNTAVFTKEPYSKSGVLGMDMIRLALERTKEARDALNFIVSIIEQYGQGGSGSYEHKLLYHNSFVIMDKKEAWVLETAGKYWVAKKVDTVYSISNALTIDRDWDLASKNVIEHAIEKKWCKDDKDFSFTKCYSDKFYTYFAHGRERRAFTFKMLKEMEGKIDLEYLISILSSHSKRPYSPETGSMKDICMHYGGTTRPSQTANSQISQIGEDFQVHWFTGTSLPCMSIFKPVFLETGLPDLGEKPTNKYNGKSYWWVFERYHRIIQTNYRQNMRVFLKQKNGVQKKIIEHAEWIKKLYLEKKIGKEELYGLTDWAFAEERNLVKNFEDKFKVRQILFPTYCMNIKRVNEKAGIKFKGMSK
jgi:dipeptidase